MYAKEHQSYLPNCSTDLFFVTNFGSSGRRYNKYSFLGAFIDHLLIPLEMYGTAAFRATWLRYNFHLSREVLKTIRSGTPIQFTLHIKKTWGIPGHWEWTRSLEFRNAILRIHYTCKSSTRLRIGTYWGQALMFAYIPPSNALQRNQVHSTISVSRNDSNPNSLS